MSSELIDPKALARKTLNGKPATNEDFARVVSDYLLGDSIRGIEPLTPTEIMKKLGYKDLKSIRQFKDLAISLSLLETDSYGKLKTPEKNILIQQFRKFDTNNDFTKNQLVRKWMDDLLIRKKGKPVKSWRSYVRSFQNVCNTTKTNPEQWIAGRNILEVLEQGRIYMKEFAKQYELGKASVNTQKRWDIEKTDIEKVLYIHSKGTRDFMKFYGFPYAKGETGVMSQNIRAFHGKYADVRASDEQIAIGKKYIKEKWTIDSDIYRVFTFGIDSCARDKAMQGASIYYTVHESKKSNKITYLMEVFESKTEQIKGGIRTKYIVDEDLQKSIDLVKARGGKFLIEGRERMSRTKKLLMAQLREVYKVMGVSHLKPSIRENPDTGYPMRKPFHTLRHFGAHFWLRKTNYNYGFVARIGDWKTIDELKDSYGEMPPEIILELLEKGIEGGISI